MARETVLIIRDIIKTGMALAEDRIFIYNQDYKIPPDRGLFVVIQHNSSQPYSSINTFDSVNNKEKLSVSLREEYTINIMSRNPDAMQRKEEIYLALNSDYARNQQGTYQFKLAWFGQRLINVSALEGGSILNRFVIDISALRSYDKNSDTLYYDDFTYPDPISGL